jgi:hypothetical protein
MKAKCIKEYKSKNGEILFKIGGTYNLIKKEKPRESGMYVYIDSDTPSERIPIVFNFMDYRFFFITVEEFREIYLESLLKDEI